MIHRLNRPDRSGLIATMTIVLLLTCVVNGVVYGLGWDAQITRDPLQPFLPPGWSIGAIWTVLLLMQAAVRWRMILKQRADVARWVSANILLAIGYPIYTAGLQFVPSIVFNGITFGIALAVAVRVGEVSRKALWLMVPTLLWFTFVNAVSARAIATLL